MSKSDISIETNLTELHKVWSDFREALPEDTRERVSKIFDIEEDWTLPKLNKAASQVMKEIVKGNVHPLAEIQFRAWFDRIMLGIHTQHMQNGTERDSGRSISTAIYSVIEESRTRSFKQHVLPVIPEPLQLEVNEPHLITAESNG